MKYKLFDICSVITDYVANGSFKTLRDNVQYNNKKDFARLIRFVDYSRNFNQQGAVYVSKHAYDFLEKTKLFGGELILANVGTIGEIFQCPTLDIPMTLGPNVVMVTTNESICIQKYLYYYFKSLQGRHLLDSITSSSAVPKFNKTDLRNQTIDLPNLEIQKKVVRILSAFDNKIELNNQQNLTLQKVLQENLTRLLNNNIIDSHSIKLQDLVCRNTKRFAKKDDWKDLKILDLSVMPRFNICLSEWSCGNNFDSNILELKQGDIMFGAIRPYFGKCCFAPFDGGFAGTVINVRPQEEYMYCFLLGLLSSNHFIKYATVRAGGTKMPVLSWKDFCDYNVPEIDYKKMLTFESANRPLIQKMQNNIDENIRLTSLRDILLPKLMNDKIVLEKVLT